MRLKWINLLLLLPLAVTAQPKLSGTYDVGTLTPLERPAAFGDHLELTPDQAEQMSARIAAMMAQDAAASDPNRGAPPNRVAKYAAEVTFTRLLFQSK